MSESIEYWVSYDDYCHDCKKPFQRGIDKEHDNHNTLGKHVFLKKSWMTRLLDSCRRWFP